MTAEDFNLWLTHTGLSGLEAAKRLGISKNTVVKYRRTGTPLHIALACAALASGIKPWDNKSESDAA